MYETLLSNHAKIMDTGPGGKELIAGDRQAGYFGDLTGTEFTSGNNLASLIGLTVGTALNTDTDWLKFMYKGRILYVPKKPLRVDLSWSDLHQKGAVFGTAVVTIKERQYRVRLMKGSGVDPYRGVNGGSDDPLTVGSEYNDLMYRVCSIDPPSQTLPNFVSFTPTDLGMYSSGGVQLCQDRSEPSGGVVPGVLCRGNGASDIATSHSPAESYSAGRGWRPVLEVA